MFIFLIGFYAEIDSPYGHDAFLLEVDRQSALIRPFLANASKANRSPAGRERKEVAA